MRHDSDNDEVAGSTPAPSTLPAIAASILLAAFAVVGLYAGNKAANIYGSTEIKERHRHRYEVNNPFLPKLEEAGLVIGGVSAGRERLVETIELPQHPWFFACQFHPEFTSTPRKGHPLFTAYIKAALANKKA